jgi:hypothetical protein
VVEMSGVDRPSEGDNLDWVRRSLDAWPVFDVVSVVEANDGAPDRLTVYPRSAEAGLATRWITAEEGSFVAVEDVR